MARATLAPSLMAVHALDPRAGGRPHARRSEDTRPAGWGPPHLLPRANHTRPVGTAFLGVWPGENATCKAAPCPLLPIRSTTPSKSYGNFSDNHLGRVESPRVMGWQVRVDSNDAHTGRVMTVNTAAASPSAKPLQYFLAGNSFSCVFLSKVGGKKPTALVLSRPDFLELSMRQHVHTHTVLPYTWPYRFLFLRRDPCPLQSIILCPRDSEVLS